MKVLHIVFGYLPDAPGGTELYVDALCRHLMPLGVESVVVAPGARDAAYELDGLRVRRFAVGDTRLHDLYEGHAGAAATIGRILDEEAPELVHQHALTPACSTRVAREARQRQRPTVFTYHTPTATCQRGTLLEFGARPCDGRLDVTRCTACTLDGLGTGAVLSRVLAAAPVQGGQLIERAGWQGGGWTALRMTSLVERRHDALRQFFTDIDRFVVLAPWVADLLRTNGVPEWKLVSSLHGVDGQKTLARLRPAADGRLRCVHLGRIDPVKGTDLLIRAWRRLPSAAPIDLDVYGVVQDAGGNRLMERLRSLAEGDPRIRFLPSVPHDAVATTLQDYDLVIVPSQWMETGPLVALEAFAAGVPVMGSDLGGLSDKVRDDIDGLLVRPFDSVEAWALALRRCVEEPERVKQWTRAVAPPRRASVVAEEMRALYHGLLSTTARADRGQQPLATGHPA